MKAMGKLGFVRFVGYLGSVRVYKGQGGGLEGVCENQGGCMRGSEVTIEYL